MTSRSERNKWVNEAGTEISDLGSRTARGGAIGIASQGARIGLQIATSVVMARLLSPQDFGLVAMAATVTSFVGLFTDFGLSAATVQRREIDQETVSMLFFINIALGILLMLAAFAAAPLASEAFGDRRVLWITMAIAASLPVNAAGAQHTALLQRGMRWVHLQWTGIAAQLVAALIAIGLASSGIGYWALVAQTWTSALVTMVLVWSVCGWRPSAVRSFGFSRSAVKFGLGLTGFNVINYFHRQLDNVLIGSRWGAVELGHYSRAYGLLGLPMSLISGPVASVVQPALSRLQDDPVRWRRSFLECLSALTLASSGIAAALIAAAHPMVMLLYGPRWEIAAQIFSVLAISMFPVMAANAMGWIYVSLGRTRRLLSWGAVGVPPFIIAFLIGVQYGPLGVAAAYTATNFLLFIPEIYFACHGTPVRARQIFKVVVPFILAGAAAGALGTLGCKLMLSPDASDLARLLVLLTGTLAAYLLFAGLALLTQSAYFDLRTRIFRMLRLALRAAGGRHA